MEKHEHSTKSWEDCYEKQRSFLISYAFRMTGSLMDAEDIVQDTISDCLKREFNSLTNHSAWMTRVCSNKALDMLKSAHKKRNEYIGMWLPEMIPQTFEHEITRNDGESHLEMAESLTISFLMLLQKLTPIERAIFLLKDVFGYSFKEVSDLLEKSEVSCRKVAERARKAINSENHKFPKPPENTEKLIHQFFEAAKNGNRTLLEDLLSDQSEFMSDGGGKVPAAPLLKTKAEICDFFYSLRYSPIFSHNYNLKTTWVNSRPGLIISKLTLDGKSVVETIMSFEIEHKEIVRIFAQRNPEKLRALNNNEGLAGKMRQVRF